MGGCFSSTPKRRYNSSTYVAGGGNPAPYGQQQAGIITPQTQNMYASPPGSFPPHSQISPSPSHTGYPPATQPGYYPPPPGAYGAPPPMYGASPPGYGYGAPPPQPGYGYGQPPPQRNNNDMLMGAAGGMLAGALLADALEIDVL